MINNTPNRLRADTLTLPIAYPIKFKNVAQNGRMPPQANIPLQIATIACSLIDRKSKKEYRKGREKDGKEKEKNGKRRGKKRKGKRKELRKEKRREKERKNYEKKNIRNR